MASSLRPASRLVVRPIAGSSILRQADRSPFLRATAQFHTSTPRNALPSGPPPQGYRLPRPKRFDEGEHVMDKASNYFLLTEMFRGMYVVLEQFFRPPYGIPSLIRAALALDQALIRDSPVIQFSIPLKKVPSLPDSGENTLYDDIRPARRDVSLASCVKLFALLWPSQSRPKNEKTDQDGQLDMILI